MSQPTPADVGHAPVVVSNVVGSFAWGVLHDRHPALIERVRQATAYPVEQQHALDALLREIAEGGVVEALDDTEPDAAQWRQWGEGHIGRRWADVPFLWAESYFYRKLLAALGYFTPGPWKGIDPFAPFKRAELMGATLDAELAALDEIPVFRQRSGTPRCCTRHSGGTGPTSVSNCRPVTPVWESARQGSSWTTRRRFGTCWMADVRERCAWSPTMPGRSCCPIWFSPTICSPRTAPRR